MIYLEKPKDFVANIHSVGCFIDSQGGILQLLRSDSAKCEPRTWGCPAGKIEKGECPITAMVREIKEETGLLILPSQLKHVTRVYVDYSTTYGCRFDYDLFWMSFSYRPEIKLSREHQAYVWIAPHLAVSLNLMQDEWDCIKLVFAY